MTNEENIIPELDSLVEIHDEMLRRGNWSQLTIPQRWEIAAMVARNRLLQRLSDHLETISERLAGFQP